MSPTAHFLASWLSGTAFKLDQREVRVVTFAGLIPDLDGFGMVVDGINSLCGNTSHYYSEFHHVLGHGFIPALLVSFLATLFFKSRRLVVFGVSMFVYHVHLLCDLIGSGGPGSNVWSIQYFYPISSFESSISWQWSLSGWQNLTILGILFVISIFVSSRVGHSPFGVLSAWVDRELFKMARKYGSKVN